MSVPNQKIILINKPSERATRSYFKLTHKNTDRALETLSTKAFLLWLYFSKWQDKFKLELSPIHFCAWSGLSKSSYDRALAEMIQQGYLIQSAKQKNLYLFNEYSDTAKTLRNESNDKVKVLDKAEFEQIKDEFLISEAAPQE